MVAPDSEKIREFLLKSSGKSALITIQNIGEKRTNKQLSYWFGVVVDAIYQQRLKEAGYSWVEAKAMCKRKAMGTREVTINGKIETFDRSLTDPDVDTLEMIIISWQLENWAHLIGVELPEMVTDEEYNEAIKQRNNE